MFVSSVFQVLNILHLYRLFGGLCCMCLGLYDLFFVDSTIFSYLGSFGSTMIPYSY